jgi:hypothetical protein
MSVTRGQYLLSNAGAAMGAIFPSFYHRALEFLEQFGKPLQPLHMRRSHLLRTPLIKITLGALPERDDQGAVRPGQ